MKSVIAVARPLVPAVALIMLVPIMPPMDMEIWLTPFLPSMTPSEASFIMAVTIADEIDIDDFSGFQAPAASRRVGLSLTLTPR